MYVSRANAGVVPNPADGGTETCKPLAGNALRIVARRAKLPASDLVSEVLQFF
jgi:hypothetical protein